MLGTSMPTDLERAGRAARTCSRPRSGSEPNKECAGGTNSSNEKVSLGKSAGKASRSKRAGGSQATVKVRRSSPGSAGSDAEGSDGDERLPLVRRRRMNEADRDKLAASQESSSDSPGPCSRRPKLARAVAAIVSSDSVVTGAVQKIGGKRSASGQLRRVASHDSVDPPALGRNSGSGSGNSGSGSDSAGSRVHCGRESGGRRDRGGGGRRDDDGGRGRGRGDGGDSTLSSSHDDVSPKKRSKFTPVDQAVPGGKQTQGPTHGSQATLNQRATSFLSKQDANEVVLVLTRYTANPSPHPCRPYAQSTTLPLQHHLRNNIRIYSAQETLTKPDFKVEADCVHHDASSSMPGTPLLMTGAPFTNSSAHMECLVALFLEVLSL